MRKRLIASAVAAGAAGIVVAVAVGSAGAANSVVLGSVSGTPSANICVASINCTYVPFNNGSDPELVVPADGTVTSFSVKSMSTGNHVELRVLRPAAGGQYTGAGSSASETLSIASPGVNTFSVSLPVKAGDVLGLDNSDSALMFDTSSSTPITAYYELPSLADGATAAPNHSQPGYRLLMSATFVPTTTTTTTQTPPQLTNVKQSHRRWREGKKLAKFASGTHPVGTTFRFTLNEAARVIFAFKQQKCGHKCARGKLSHAFGAGAHKLTFQGRISKKKRLPPGHYKLAITATTAAGLHSPPATLRFTILAG